MSESRSINDSNSVFGGRVCGTKCRSRGVVSHASTEALYAHLTYEVIWRTFRYLDLVYAGLYDFTSLLASAISESNSSSVNSAVQKVHEVA